MKVRLLIVVVVSLLLLSPAPSSGEVFTALVHMEGLLELEKELLGVLNSYITQEKKRWAQL